MDKPQHEKGEGWLSQLADPPDAVAWPALLLTLIHLAASAAPDRMVYRAWREFELAPVRVFGAAGDGDYLRVIKVFLGHMMFHVNFAHLFFNLAAILMFGGFISREMALHARDRKSDGPAAFVAFLIISGMAAGLVYVLAVPASYAPIIGASGAASGLAGASVWVWVTRDGNGDPRGGVLKNAAIIVLISALVVSLTIFLDTSKLSHLLFNNNSAYPAHIGGYLFGVLTYPVFERLAGAGKRRA